ncbi:hypothetical protein D3873_12135 [Paenisporosarcina cavernae]|uniref:Uncharacterized protein n=1 Tax=Paenisporosarcina cavernae TaxID=2320858 RepID=A0A385YYW1_9BACL|nr:hypothetical protein D3873_12135 [Paenisporosarcina cavernae]
MIIRKFLTAMLTSFMVVLIYFSLDPSSPVLLFGIYLFSILMFVGIPTSIVSDFLTKKQQGLSRLLTSFILHVGAASLLVLLPFALYEINWNPQNFFFVTSLFSSFLFWTFDEMLKIQLINKKLCMNT